MSDDNYKHLTESAKPIVDLPDQKRIQWLENHRWIGYGMAKTIIEKLNWRLNLKPSDRMPNLLIYGDTNNGKTTIVKQFALRNHSKENEKTGLLEYPVMYMQMPPSPEESRFYDSMLNILKAPYRQRDSISRKQNQAITMMNNLGVRLLIIDEFHHMLIGHKTKQRLFLQSIKYLSNELRIPIVTVGTDDALRAIRVIPQISNRFEQIELPRWQSNDDFRRLLASFERVLPIKKASKLSGLEISRKLYSMCEGNIGELSTLLNEATTKAIKSKDEKITLSLLDKIDWVQPVTKIG